MRHIGPIWIGKTNLLLSKGRLWGPYEKKLACWSRKWFSDTGGIRSQIHKSINLVDPWSSTAPSKTCWWSISSSGNLSTFQKRRAPPVDLEYWSRKTTSQNWSGKMGLSLLSFEFWWTVKFNGHWLSLGRLDICQMNSATAVLRQILRQKKLNLRHLLIRKKSAYT